MSNSTLMFNFIVISLSSMQNVMRLPSLCLSGSLQRHKNLQNWTKANFMQAMQMHPLLFYTMTHKGQDNLCIDKPTLQDWSKWKV